MKIALIGDYNEQVDAHRAIPLAIRLASEDVDFEWLHTNEVDVDGLEQYSGFWVVPASPYENKDNVMQVIEFARVNNVPFLGTCGGCQHAVLEYAVNVLGYAKADNGEDNPTTTMPLIAPLSCRLNAANEVVNLVEGSIVAECYGTSTINEIYNCGYGINAKYLGLFENSGLHFSGFNDDGDPRTIEIPGNDFFVGTAFQPERSAFLGEGHPLVDRFVQSLGTLALL